MDTKAGRWHTITMIYRRLCIGRDVLVPDEIVSRVIPVKPVGDMFSDSVMENLRLSELSFVRYPRTHPSRNTYCGVYVCEKPGRI